jgi:hypothetical protein
MSEKPWASAKHCLPLVSKMHGNLHFVLALIDDPALYDF